MHANNLVAIIGLAGSIVLADNWLVSSILPAIAKGIGVNPGSAGILIAAYMLPFGFFSLMFGPCRLLRRVTHSARDSRGLRGRAESGGRVRRPTRTRLEEIAALAQS